jgi:hypothetical protein
MEDSMAVVPGCLDPGREEGGAGWHGVCVAHVQTRAAAHWGKVCLQLSQVLHSLRAQA